jgi:hypothetical protein
MTPTKKTPIKVLELFAGSRSIGQCAERRSCQIFSIDWHPYPQVDLVADIGQLELEDVPFIPDVIWASPDCTTYSIAACSTHRFPDKRPRSAYASQCDQVNQHFLELIDQWLQKNPRLVYFIENPRGMLRHMLWMKKYNRHTVWLCQYGDERAKPTDIWTNSKTWTPRPGCRNFKYDKEGKILGRHCHHEGARRGARTGTQGRKNSYTRSMIPQELCQEVLESAINSARSCPLSCGPGDFWAGGKCAAAGCWTRTGKECIKPTSCQAFGCNKQM